MRLRIKYCGGCNPSINRSKLVNQVLDEVRSMTNIEIVNDAADVGLVVAGCPVCCVNVQEIEDQADQWVIVGGNTVDHIQFPVDKLPEITLQKILEKGGV